MKNDFKDLFDRLHDNLTSVLDTILIDQFDVFAMLLLLIVNDEKNNSEHHSKHFERPVSKIKKRKTTEFSYAFTNARSLAPKIGSLIDAFEELGLLVITESWLKVGKDLRDAIADLDGGASIGMVMRNRLSRRKRTAGGGVAVAFNKNRITLKPLPSRVENCEILMTSGKLCGLSRKLVVIAAYIPPRTRAAGRDKFVDVLSRCIGQAKQDLNDPLILVAGDFNRFDVVPAVADYPDVQFLITPPTRGVATIDLAASNFNDSVTSINVRPPLETECRTKQSDHNVIQVTVEIGNSDRFTKETYWKRNKTKKGMKKAAVLIKTFDWTHLFASNDAEEKARILVDSVDNIMEECFPMKKYTTKSSDDPWITPFILSKIRSRKRMFEKDHRGERWTEKKKETDCLIKGDCSLLFRFSFDSDPGCILLYPLLSLVISYSGIK